MRRLGEHSQDRSRSVRERCSINNKFVFVHKSDKVLHKKGAIVMIYSFEGQLISEGNRNFSL